MPTFSTLFSTILGIIDKEISPDNEKKEGWKLEKEVKLTPFANGMILFVHRYPLRCHQNLLELLKHF